MRFKINLPTSRSPSAKKQTNIYARFSLNSYTAATATAAAAFAINTHT